MLGREWEREGGWTRRRGRKDAEELGHDTVHAKIYKVHITAPVINNQLL